MFVNQTKQLQKEYETLQYPVFIKNGKGYLQRDPAVRKFKICDDGIVREMINPNDFRSKVFLSKEAQQYTFGLMNVSQIYPSFKAYADDVAEYHAEQKAYGYYEEEDE